MAWHARIIHCVAVREGRCHIGLSNGRKAAWSSRGLRGGTADSPYVIAGAAGAVAVIDGTVPLEGQWRPAAATRPGVWQMEVPRSATPLGGVTQLRMSGEMATPARWPNALWADRSVFNWTSWSKFDRRRPWAPARYRPGQPLTLFDAGGPRGLGASGVSAKGAIFVGNIAHDDTFVGTVTAHDAGSDQFEVLLESSVDKMGNTKVGNSYYFLEGLASFVDLPTEWSFAASTRLLTVRTADGAAPAAVTVKASTYAFNITDSPHLVLANLTLFGTTINAQGPNIGHLRLDTVDFVFPSFSRRMLGDVHTPAPTVLSAAALAGARGQPTPAESSFVVVNSTFFGADGRLFEYWGSAGVWRNNLFEANDWTCHDDDTHIGMGCALIDASAGVGDLFTRNTLLGNGPSVGYSCGARATVTLNHCAYQADIDNDGVCIQISSSSASSTTLAFNWVERSAKGLRLDSGSNSAFCASEVNNSILFNVAVLSGGFELKHDYNNYTGNLALWPPPVWLTRKGNRTGPVWRVDTGRFKGENVHSILESNVASSWAAPIVGLTRPSHGNRFDAGVGSEMVDPRHGDFRPRPGTELERTGAGPYGSAAAQREAAARDAFARAAAQAGAASPTHHAVCEEGEAYWIPGRLSWRPTSPVPPDGATAVPPDRADLMFLGVEGSAHTVYLGEEPGALAPVGALRPGCNVAGLRGQELRGNATWHWRVVAEGGVASDVWSFTTAH